MPLGVTFYRATQLCQRGLGSRNSVRLSVDPSIRLSICHARALQLIQRTYRRYFIPHERAILLVKCDFSYTCAAADNISTDLRRRAVPLRQLSYLLLWPLYVIGQAIIFSSCSFFFLSFYLLSYSSPNLSSRRLDVYHTSTYGVALVRIQDAGVKRVKRAARGSLKIQDAKIAILAPSHNFVGLYLRS